MTASSRRVFSRPAHLAAALCWALGLSVGCYADVEGLEAARDSDSTNFVVPVLEYTFRNEAEPASPMEYASVKGDNLPMSMRHRMDSIWSDASAFVSMGASASDFPVVADVAYRLRSSPWSDPDRMVEARLLGGGSIRALVAKQFGVGRNFELSAALQHSEAVYSSRELALVEQTSIPIEVRMEIDNRTDLIAGVELEHSRITDDGVVTDAMEESVKLGLGSEISDSLYGQISGGFRLSDLDGADARKSFEMNAALVWKESANAQYTLTFNRSTRPSLLANQFADSDTVALAGDYTISGMWSSYFGIAQSWAELESSVSKEIFSSEIAISFTPTESVSFSGGYVYRSGSLKPVDEDDAERIVRLSASILY